MDTSETEREGFYERMWKDFVSLQRGDAKQICVDAARYRWWRENAHKNGNRTCFFGPEDFEDYTDEMLKTPNYNSAT